MWDLPGPGLKPVSPALAGRFLTTVPPGKSPCFTLDPTWRCLRRPFLQCQFPALHTPYVPISADYPLFSENPIDSPFLAALPWVLEADLHRVSPSLPHFPAVGWVCQIEGAWRRSEGGKRGRSGCLVPHLTPCLPQPWHLLCSSTAVTLTCWPFL